MLDRFVCQLSQGAAVDEIDNIVNKAIQYTEEILTLAPCQYAIARDGLERMRDTLKTGAEEHEALRRLEKYLDELIRRVPN